MTRPLLSRSVRRAALIVGSYLALYVLLDIASLVFRTDSVVSLWYLSDGLSLALLLVYGIRYAPAIVVSALITNLVIYPNVTPPAFMLIWAVVFPLPFVAIAALLRRRLQDGSPTHHLRDAGLLISGCLVLSLILAGMFIVTVLFSKGAMPTAQSAFTGWPAASFRWWLGEAIGLVLVTPLLLFYVVPHLLNSTRKCNFKTRSKGQAAVASTASHRPRSQRSTDEDVHAAHPRRKIPDLCTETS